MSMLNLNEFTALYSKYSCNVVMAPGKIKNMIWDKYASLFFFKFVIGFYVYICTVYFFIVLCVSANLQRYRAFLLFYLCMFVCILCIIFDSVLPFGIINDDDYS